MRAPMILLMAMTLAIVTAGISAAETIYVGDRLVVGIRETPEDAAPSIGTLKSDDPVELLAEGERYHKIRTSDGTVGYIRNQYLTRNRPKALIIADLEKQLARQKQAMSDLKASMSSTESEIEQKQVELQKTIEQLEQQLAAGKKKLAESGRQLDATRKELAVAQQQYEKLKRDADDVVNIVKEREALKQENERLTDELNTMREDNVYLLTTFYIKWFLAGAGVMFVGWMIGKSSRRKRRY